jgi:SET domain-containing protein
MKYDIEVRRTRNKGRGVFATKNFDRGDVIEICPVLTLTPTERKILEKTVFNYYIYPWRSVRGASMVLGYGSIYNHAYDPNADWKQDFRGTNMVYRAIKPIKKGDEITVNYNGEPDDDTPLDWLGDQETNL